MPVTVIKRGGGLRALEEKLAILRRSEVYVGVPSERTLRKSDQINNSSLMFLLTHGSPLRNIPATPILEPAVEKAGSLISPELALAAKAVFEKNPNEATRHLKLAGQIASNAAKRYFTNPDNGWPVNAPSTIRAKLSKKTKRQLAKGQITWDQAAAGVNRNIDTGALLKAITYVVAESGREVQNPD